MRSPDLVKVIFACVCALLCSSCGPHMIEQQSIQPYQQTVPNMPSGTVPTRGRLETLTVQQSKLAKNPLPNTPVNLKNGRIYYGYYCLMCHGNAGDGDGAVGASYVPKPTDLSSPAVAALSDGELYQRMLIGIGHDPVMTETVAPSQRWPLVMYVRTFAKGTRSGPRMP